MSVTPRFRHLFGRLNPMQRRWGGGGLATGLVLAVVLVAVTGTGSSPPTSSFADCGGPDQLTLATGDDISAGSFRRDLVEAWNNTRKTKVTLVEVADRTDEERAEMVGRARLKSCAYDIFVLDVAWMAEFARSGYIRPFTLKEDKSSTFVENVLNSGKVDGIQYGVPLVTDAPLLFYRRGAPTPTTVEQLWKYAEEKNVRGENKGYVVQLGDYEGASVNLLEAIRSADGRVTDGDRIVVDEEKFRDRVRGALSHWHAMLNQKIMAPGVENFTKEDTFNIFRDGLLPQEAKNLLEENSLRAFRDGHVSYMRNWPFAFHRMATDPSMYDSAGPLFGLAPLPGVGTLGGFNLAISAHLNDAKAQEAQRLIEFLTRGDAQQKLFACSGYPPVLESVYEEYRRNPRTCDELPTPSPDAPDSLAAPTVTDPAPAPTGKDAEQDTSIKINRAMLQDLAAKIHQAVVAAEPRPQYSHYAIFSRVFRACTRAVVIGTLPVEEFDVDGFADALRDARRGRLPGDDNEVRARCTLRKQAERLVGRPV